MALAEIMGTYLRRELQCEVHCAADCEEAEALLDCYSYSLALVDLSFTPDRLEGLDLIEEIADAERRPGILALSGYGTDSMRSLALDMGADVFLEKPQPLPEILSVLRQLLCASPFSSPKPPSKGRLLQRVLSKDAVVPVIQPIFQLDANGYSLAGVECLSRGPAGTPFQRADAVFAYARHKRAEHIVDQHCISVILQAASAIPAHIPLFINVHASTLGRCGDFCDWLCATAAQNSIDPRRLTIEFVEHTPPWSKSEFLRNLEALRNAGMRIALDDVGLCHSNLQMMVEAKPDYLKLDRYFIDGCHRDRYRRAVVASVAKLAEEMGSSLIAEGIEDPADLAVLQGAGITLVQGYLFCRPIRFDQLQGSQHSGNFCSCALAPAATNLTQCPLKGLQLCSHERAGAARDGMRPPVDTPIFDHPSLLADSDDLAVS